MADINGGPSNPSNQSLQHPAAAAPAPAAPTATQTQTPPPPQPGMTSTDPLYPETSSTDPGMSRRPRDARLIHMLLANRGVAAYQERVPQMLMDFAYRHTRSTIEDSLHLTSEAYASNAAPGKVNNNDQNTITLPSVNLSIGSRTMFQFNPHLPKEEMMELAQEYNRTALPVPSPRHPGSLRLPPPEYVMNGVGFALKDTYESEGEEVSLNENMDTGEEGTGEGNEEFGTEEGGTMEDVFGDNYGEGKEDQEMGNA